MERLKAKLDRVEGKSLACIFFTPSLREGTVAELVYLCVSSDTVMVSGSCRGLSR